MRDLSIDEARAKVWMEDVNQEIEEVEALLKQINRAASAIPGEDDVIMQNIESTCNVLTDFWNQMCNGFKSANKSLASIIENIGKAATNVVDDINSVKSRIGS